MKLGMFTYMEKENHHWDIIICLSNQLFIFNTHYFLQRWINSLQASSPDLPLRIQSFTIVMAVWYEMIEKIPSLPIIQNSTSTSQYTHKINHLKEDRSLFQVPQLQYLLISQSHFYQSYPIAYSYRRWWYDCLNQTSPKDRDTSNIPLIRLSSTWAPAS